MSGHAHPHDKPAIGMCDALMPQTDAQNGGLAPKVAHHIVGNPSLQRSARPGGDHDVAGAEGIDFR
ncbi:hypothetical protein ES703_53158 [subsurface metagenome]